MVSQIDGGAVASNRANASFVREGGSSARAFGWAEKCDRKFREPGTYGADGGFFFVKNPDDQELAASYALLADALGDIAPLEVVKSVYGRNALAWWVLWRSDDEHRRTPRMTGVASYVPLNAVGLATVRRGDFSARNPDLKFVCAADEKLAGLYLWGVVARGLSDLVGKLVGHAIGLDTYEQLPMIGTIGTQQGLDALRRSTKSALDASALKIGSIFEIKLPPKHIQHQREMRVWEGESVFLSATHLKLGE